jgi:hypothetical protein
VILKVSIVSFEVIELCTLANSGSFLEFYYQGGVKCTAFGIFEDLKFKISEG